MSFQNNKGMSPRNVKAVSAFSFQPKLLNALELKALTDFLFEKLFAEEKKMMKPRFTT